VGQILQGRYDRLLRRTAAQVGPGSKVSNALEDLFPTLDVENAPGELLRASGWFLCMGRTNRIAAAGTTSASQLFNPIGSGKLIVLESCIIGLAASTDIQFGPTFIALTGGSVAGAERDTRRGAIAASTGLVQFQDDGAASAFGIIRVLAADPYKLNHRNGVAVLVPGTGFIVTVASLAQTLRVSYFWRERTGEPEEFGF